MKKFLSLVALIAVAVMLSSTVWAAKIDLTKYAFAFFEGSIEFSADLFDWTGDYEVRQSTGIVWWNTSDIKMKKSEAQWKNSGAYCLIKSTITTEGAQVYVYTDNQNNATVDDVVYKSTVSSSYGTYRGLVKGNSYGGEGNFAPVSCMYCSTTTAKTSYSTSQPTIDGELATGTRFLADKNDTGFVMANNIVADDNGNYVSDGTEADYRVDEDVVMFFGAGFKNVKGGQKYGTTTIKFVSNVE